MVKARCVPTPSPPSRVRNPGAGVRIPVTPEVDGSWPPCCLARGVFVFSTLLELAPGPRPAGLPSGEVSAALASGASTLRPRMSDSRTPKDLPVDLRPRFEVQARFQGGEGWTWLVAPRGEPERRLVLKVIGGSLPAREASVLASLAHPSIPSIVETGVTAAGEAYLLREFAAGDPLQASLPLAPAAAITCAVQILEVLAYVHLRGILHLDLKPANVISARGGAAARYHLLDFGLARRGVGRSAGGTPFFAAPEVLLGLPASARSDLFSLGALLVAALEPRAVESALASFVTRFPRTDFFTALGIEASAFPPPFDRILPRLLARLPDERCADAQEALELLTASSGRPSVAALDPDPIAAFGADLERALLRAEPGADLEIRGGDADDRRSLALHAACTSAGIVRVDAAAGHCRLVRGGRMAGVWEVPRLDRRRIASHLQSAVGLDAASAQVTARALLDAGCDTPAALRTTLHGLLERGRIVPLGMRWLWPDAVAGRVHLDAGAPPLAADADDLVRLAARGMVEAALAGFQRLVAADPGSDGALRAALATGYLQGGEPGRALPLVHDRPALRARALLDLGRVAEAESVARAVPESAPGAVALGAAIAAARGDFPQARAAYERAGSAVEVRVALGGVLAASGEMGRAREVLRAALTELDADRPFLRAATLTNLAEVERQAGELAIAHALHSEALHLLQAMGQVRYTAQVSSNLGVVAKDLGRLDDAREHLRRARAMFEHVGDARGAALAGANLGIASLEAGDVDLALQRLQSARDDLSRLGHREWLPLVHVFLARALALGGEAARAEAELAAVAGNDDPRIRSESAKVRAMLAVRPAPEQGKLMTVNQDSPGAVPPPEGWISRGVFRSFLAVNRRLASEARLDRAMEYLLEAAIALSGARTGLLLVVRRDGVRLELRAGDTPPTGYAFSRSLVHRAIQQRRALTAEEALADRGLMEMPSVRGLQVKSVLCVPFVSASGTEGALYVEHSGRPGVFGTLEKEHLEVLADQAAIAVDRMVREEQLAAELKHSKRDLEVVQRTGRRARPSQLLGDSAAMRAVRDQIRRLAAADLSVLILGETGTGKELVARSIHEQSAVSKGPFVSVNCAAISPDLMESELFGHVRGAFTGADEDRQGLMELASGGTLFLDEIGDMPLPMQASLLRALQEGCVRPVGSGESRAVSVRVVAATHRELRAMITAGEFRQDLYYRIAGAEIALPALRARGADVLLLADELLGRLGAQHRRALRLSEHARSQLRGYRWPGNVRELEHVLARVAILTDGDELDELSLPTDLGDLEGKPVAGGPWPVITLREAEERTLRAALAATGGDKTAAAKQLGISRTALYDKLKRLGEG